MVVGVSSWGCHYTPDWRGLSCTFCVCFNVYLFKLLSVLFPPFCVVPSPIFSALQQVPRLQARAYRIMGHMHAVCVCMRSADLHVACMRYVFAGVQLTSMASLLNSLTCVRTTRALKNDPSHMTSKKANIF